MFTCGQPRQYKMHKEGSCENARTHCAYRIPANNPQANMLLSMCELSVWAKYGACSAQRYEFSLHSFSLCCIWFSSLFLSPTLFFPFWVKDPRDCLSLWKQSLISGKCAVCLCVHNASLSAWELQQMGEVCMDFTGNRITWAHNWSIWRKKMTVL